MVDKTLVLRKLYEKIDPYIVVTLVNKNLSDFHEYRDPVTAYLAKKTKKSSPSP